MLKKYGADISEWQAISDYTPFKTLDFVILREGYRESIDKRFLQHVAGFQKAGVKIQGVYHFIYALNADDAKKEAQSCLANIKKAGLTDVVVWCDFEYDTIDSAKKKGVYLGVNECNSYTQIFCDTVKSAGYQVGIYTNNDFRKNWYTKETLDKYLLWLADYTGDPDVPCLIQQTTSNGYIDGYSGSLDLDTMFIDEGTEKRSRTAVVEKAKAWLGYNEYDGSHEVIVDTYNSFLPHPRGYRVTYYDAWCATFVSAVAISLGYTDIIPIECGCPNMIALAQNMGIWVEDDAYVPDPGDIIMYDWQDSGSGDNQGVADHVGIVEVVHDRSITVIEGNYQNSVKRRYISVDGRNIRGYIVPKYDSADDKEIISFVSGPVTTVRKGSHGDAVKALQFALVSFGYSLDIDGDFGNDTAQKLKSFQLAESLEADSICGPMTWTKIYNLLTESVEKLSRVPQFVGQVTSSTLNVRTYFSSLFDRVAEWPVLGHGNLVDICGAFENPMGDTWYFIRIAGKIFGFVSAEYVVKSE